MKRRFILYGIVLVGLALFPLGTGHLYSSFYVALLTRVFIFSVIVLGYDLLAGHSGIVSYGHAIFFGTGMYVAGLSLKYITVWFWLPLALAVAASGLVALVVGYLSLRTREIYFVFLTFAFSQFFYVISNTAQAIGAANGLSGIPKPIIFPGLDLSRYITFYYFALCILLVFLVLNFIIIHSPFGRVLVGIRENEGRMKFLGYDTQRALRRIFFVSGIYGGVSGALMGAFNSFASPASYHASVSGDVIIMAFLGGNRYLFGPVLGTAFVVILGDFLTSFVARTWMVFLGAIFGVCIIFNPTGMVGGYERLRNFISKRRLLSVDSRA
jgi:branched-chain amino acid transport system permease protein